MLPKLITLIHRLILIVLASAFFMVFCVFILHQRHPYARNEFKFNPKHSKILQNIMTHIFILTYYLYAYAIEWMQDSKMRLHSLWEIIF